MSDDVLHAVIQCHARQLRTPTIAREYAAVARRACDGGWPYEEYLRELLEAELRIRQENTARRYLKQAGFPDLKTFEQIEWDALQGISRPKLLQLASGQFIENAEDVVETADRLCRYVVATLAQGVDKLFLYSMHAQSSLHALPAMIRSNAASDRAPSDRSRRRYAWCGVRHEASAKQVSVPNSSLSWHSFRNRVPTSGSRVMAL